eukprot:scaffold10086_cov60-Phaeocystis_antarctica.AAC.3
MVQPAVVQLREAIYSQQPYKLEDLGRLRARQRHHPPSQVGADPRPRRHALLPLPLAGAPRVAMLIIPTMTILL